MTPQILPRLDTSVPALIVKLSQYPLSAGGLGAIRSLGRLGVPVCAVTEDNWTPAARSRHLQRRFVWATTGLEKPERLVEGLIDIGRQIGRPAVLIPTDDEAAVLIAEHASDLRGPFLVQDGQPSLPRRLASKQGLHELCLTHDIPTPRSWLPTNISELDKIASQARFPVVVKNLEPFVRLRAKIVPFTTRFDTAEELLSAALRWEAKFSVIVQEYLPRETTVDWGVASYYDRDSNPLVQFTGVKLRSYPPQAGMATCEQSEDNPDLKQITTQLVKGVGYQGLLDLDWRYDQRDGRYYLLDFNPRLGAQFRTFEDAAGVDAVRAMHLDLTGRTITHTDQVDGRRLIVENLHAASVLTSPRGRRPPPLPVTISEFAWWNRDDPIPAAVMLLRSVVPLLNWLKRLRRERGSAPSLQSLTSMNSESNAENGSDVT